MKVELIDVRGEVLFPVVEVEVLVGLNEGMGKMVERLRGEGELLLECERLLLDGCVVEGGGLGMRVYDQKKYGKPLGWVPEQKKRVRRTKEEMMRVRVRGEV